MRIVAVDDDPLELELLRSRLESWGHEVAIFGSGEEAWAVMEEEGRPQIAILDWMLPGISGLELCRRIRTLDGPYTYTLVLTGKAEKKDLLEGFAAGADDYLTKPYDLLELRARLRAGARIVDLQRRLIEAHEALRLQAMKDSLTGILNHGAVVQALSREVDRARREGHPLAVILADIDRFKEVNDAYGHLVGDEVLREVALRLRECLRSYDALGRYGGEEFLIVLPNIEPDPALGLAERVRQVIAQDPFRVGELEVPVTLSQGVVTWPKAEQLTPERLIGAADRALYAAKHAGRDVVRWMRFDPNTSSASLVPYPPASGRIVSGASEEEGGP